MPPSSKERVWKDDFRPSSHFSDTSAWNSYQLQGETRTLGINAWPHHMAAGTDPQPWLRSWTHQRTLMHQTQASKVHTQGPGGEAWGPMMTQVSPETRRHGPQKTRCWAVSSVVETDFIQDYCNRGQYSTGLHSYYNNHKATLFLSGDLEEPEVGWGWKIAKRVR